MTTVNAMPSWAIFGWDASQDGQTICCVAGTRVMNRARLESVLRDGPMQDMGMGLWREGKPTPVEIVASLQMQGIVMTWGESWAGALAALFQAWDPEWAQGSDQAMRWPDKTQRLWEWPRVEMPTSRGREV